MNPGCAIILTQGIKVYIVGNDDLCTQLLRSAQYFDQLLLMTEVCVVTLT